MKPIFFIPSAAIVLFGFATCNNNSDPAAPLQPPPTASVGELKIAYVNNDSVLEQYELTKTLQEELIQERMMLENQFKTEYQKLEKDFKDAEAGASQLSPEALQILQNKLAQKENSLMEYKNSLDQQLYESEESKNALFLSEIQKFLDEYAKAEGYHVIFAYNKLGNVWYMDKSFDITNVVVDSLNALYLKENPTAANP